MSNVICLTLNRLIKTSILPSEGITDLEIDSGVMKINLPSGIKHI